MASMFSYSPEKEVLFRKITGALFILVAFLVPSELIVEKNTIIEVTYSSLLYLVRVITPVSVMYGENPHWEITLFPMSLVFKIPLLIVVYFGYELLRSEVHQEINVLGVIGVSILQVLFMFSALVVPRGGVVSHSLIPYAEVVLIIIALGFLGWLGLVYEQRYKLLKKDEGKENEK